MFERDTSFIIHEQWGKNQKQLKIKYSLVCLPQKVILENQT